MFNLGKHCGCTTTDHEHILSGQADTAVWNFVINSIMFFCWFTVNITLVRQLFFVSFQVIHWSHFSEHISKIMTLFLQSFFCYLHTHFVSPFKHNHVFLVVSFHEDRYIHFAKQSNYGHGALITSFSFSPLTHFLPYACNITMLFHQFSYFLFCRLILSDHLSIISFFW